VIEGLYLVGSVALDDWTPHSDIDVVAVVADPSDPDLFDDLAAAHTLVRDCVSIAVDGPYVAWGDLVVPPMAVQRPWVLDGEYHVDGESFEINPVTWYTLATHGIALRGDPADRLGVHVDLGERRSGCVRTSTYWRGAGERLRRAIEADRSSETADGAVLEWVALGVARMLYTWETGEVIVEVRGRTLGRPTARPTSPTCCVRGRPPSGSGTVRDAGAAARREIVHRTGR
jgi:hypothetical protein